MNNIYLITTIRPASLLALTRTWQYSAMFEASTAYTRFAPACTAKNDKMPDPAPTSRTTLPTKSTLEFARIAR